MPPATSDLIAEVRAILKAREQPGRTHWDGCWRDTGHRDCLARLLLDQLPQAALDQADRQLLGLALATLKIRRPGFGYAIGELAKKIGEGVPYYAETLEPIVADEMRGPYETTRRD